MASCKLLAVLVLVHNFEGLLGAEVKSSIIGGNDAKEGEWKWMVQLNFTSDGITTWGCGGTILNDQWVLTAASCWDKEPDQSRIMVLIGVHKLDVGAGRYLGIKNVIKHPEYLSFHGGNQNNIALVQLKKKLKPEHVTPVTLPNANDVFDESSECWVTGWGDVGRNELPAPKTLQEVKLPIVRADVCMRKYNWLSSDVLCVGGKLGGIGACKGDEGGPLVCKTARGYVQAGIVSFVDAQGCGLPKQPSVYTRVSKYLTFINDWIHRGQEISAEV